MDAQKKFSWIKDQFAAGRTVYIHTAFRIFKVAPKHAALITLSASGKDVRLQNGKSSVSIIFNGLTAR